MRVLSFCGVRPGFTLVELMISIAMVLLLMLGINAVFSATQKTASTGMALSSITRDQRAMERTLTRDFGRAAPLGEMPCIIINSRQVYAFRDRADQTAAADPKDPSNYDWTGTGASQQNPACIYNQRNHRLDSIGFFARDIQTPFTRQTGNQYPPGTPIRPLCTWPLETSREAYIWYGHLNLPPNTQMDPNPAPAYASGDYFEPGQPDLPTKQNASNYYYSDWGFGRVTMLLRPPMTNATNIIVGGPMGNYPYPLGRDSQAVLVQNLMTNTFAPAPIPFPSGGGSPWLIQHSRFDTVNTTIRAFHDYLMTGGAGGVPIPATYVDANNGNAPWLTDAFDYRFNGKPWVAKFDPTGAPRDMGLEAALTFPLLMKGVSHFTVEFAGDFVGQLNDPNDPRIRGSNGRVQLGDLIPPPPGMPQPPVQARDMPDGQIDYVVVNGARQIRWYGMPRFIVDPTKPLAAPSIPATPGSMSGNTPLPVQRSPSVVPLSDISPVAANGAAAMLMRVANAAAPCEEFYQIDPATKAPIPPTVLGNVGNDYVAGLQPLTPASGLAYAYRAVFSPYRLSLPDNLVGKPSLIKLTVTFTDPNGRLPEGYTAEYVFALSY